MYQLLGKLKVYSFKMTEKVLVSGNDTFFLPTLNFCHLILNWNNQDENFGNFSISEHTFQQKGGLMTYASFANAFRKCK